MLASAFVARHRRVHSRGTDTAAAVKPPGSASAAPAPPYRTRALPGDTRRHAQRRGGSGRRPRRAAGELPVPRTRAAPPEPRAEQGATAEATAAGLLAAEEEEEAASVASSAQLCAVCLEDLRHGEAAATVLPCSHAYHPACVGPWLADHRACPCCRAAVQETLPHES